MNASLSFLTRSILIAMSAGLCAAPALANNQATPAPKFSKRGVEDAHTIAGHLAWGIQHANTQDALISNVQKEDNENRNIYYSHNEVRQNNQSQSLTLENSNFDGHTVNMTKQGNATLIMNNSSADFVESGDSGKTTNTTIIMNHSHLNGPIKDNDYDSASHSKSYLREAAIYQDHQDLGNFTASLMNGSVVTGNIDAATDGGVKLVRIADNSKVKGKVLLGGASSTLQQIDSTVSNDVIISGTQTATADLQGATNANITAWSSGNTSVSIAKNSDISGTVQADGKNVRVAISDSTVGRDLKIGGTESTDVSMKNAHVNGDITLTGDGIKTVVLEQNSTVAGKLNAVKNDAKNSLYMEKGSSLRGDVLHFGHISAKGNNSLVLSNLENGTVSLSRDSRITVDTLKDTTINADASDTLNVKKALSGNNTLNVLTIAPHTAAGTRQLADLAGGSEHLNPQFANKAKTSSVRDGAKNYKLSLSESMDRKDHTAVMMTVADNGLTSDVRGAIAGLEGARQSGIAVADSLASHLNPAHSVQNGVSVWADYLMRNGKNADAEDYHNNLQGSVLGMDWTQDAGESSHLTSGVAFAVAQNRMTNTNDGNSYTNKQNNHYYSLYSGWQQESKEDCCGYFANGSFTYGDIRSSQNALNVVEGATTNAREQLMSASKGKTYNAEIRGGLNIKASDYANVQPYIIAGWSKATDSGFTNQYVTVDRNSNESRYAGAGIRAVSHFSLGSVNINPWVDAAYTTELGNKADFYVNGERVSQGHKRRTETLGAGTDVAITPALDLNVGAYTGAGSVKNDVSVLAGIKYTF